MAEPSTMLFSTMISQIDGIQAGLRLALAAGNVPEDEEIQTRALVSQCLHERFKALQRPKDLSDAIEHLEIVVRRLPPESAELPQHFDELSYMKVSEYARTQSVRSLNEAVDYGKRARDVALKTNLLAKDPDAYFSILNNLGYAQSHRWAVTTEAQGLDDAIASGQEILRLAPKDSQAYGMALVNLSSRMRLRYTTRKDVADREEAIRLINEVLERSSPGSIDRTLTFIQLGELSYEKFQEEGDLKDLDEAIEQGAACLKDLSSRHEKYADVVGRMCQMYCDRYKKTKDLADAKKVIMYSQSRVWSSMPSHPITGTHIYNHMLYVRDYVKASSSVSDVETVVKDNSSFLEGLRENHAKREGCYWVYGDILGRQYELSGKLGDLITFVENNEKICNLHNERMHKEGDDDVSSQKVYHLLRTLKKIGKASDESKIKILACKKLTGYYQAACDLSGVPNAPIAIWNANGTELEEISDALESNPDISETELNKLIENREAKIRAAKEVSRNRPVWRPEQYHTELGLRSLAMDVANKGEIIFDLSRMVSDVFGYKEIEPLKMDQFVKREERLEQEAREEEASKGKNPNPNLCRICRKLKIFKPSFDGFTWNEKLEYIPFGNYNQLRNRPCAICSLILTLISKDGSLRPRLAAIDTEIQGTAIKPIKLASGETILQVKYGLRQIGSLRIVPNQHDMDSSAKTLLDAQTVSLPRLKRWLNNCDHNHGRKCNPPIFLNAISMIQIDVVDNCLVRTTSSVKYFALSYVWGKVSMSQTLLSNVDDRLKKEGLGSALNEQLPKTIQDAMSLVKNLGERYLWVDALCIVQDDYENKQRDIQQMDIVYSRAFASIVAMEGVDAEAGLPGVAVGSRSPQSVEKIIITDKSPDLAYIPQSGSNEELSVIASPVSFGLALDSSKWDTRAWTMQERLLSKRCLYFAKDCVYFQCSLECHNETDVPEPEVGHAASTLANPLQILAQPEEMSESALVRRNFGAYKGLVEKYTLRELSFPADILNAFAGVSAVLCEHLSGSLLFGLPAELLDLALLWNPAKPLKRRDDLIPNSGVVAKQIACPTWSWAGFVGPVEYRFFMADQFGPLPKPLIESYRICQGGNTIRTIKLRDKKPPQTSDQDFPAKELSPASTELPTIGPIVLEFEATTLPITAFKIDRKLEYLSLQEQIHTSGQSAVVRLYDDKGVHCGLCFNLPTAPPGNEATESRFVAVSQERAKYVGGRGAGYSGIRRVEGEIPLSDVDVYGAGEVVNVLLVTGADVASRISVARIHLKAWEVAGPVKVMMRLG